MDLSNLNNEDIMKLYKENIKITNYSEIYAYLISKDKEVKTWPSKINSIKFKRQRDAKKKILKNVVRNILSIKIKDYASSQI